MKFYFTSKLIDVHFAIDVSKFCGNALKFEHAALTQSLDTDREIALNTSVGFSVRFIDFKTAVLNVGCNHAANAGEIYVTKKIIQGQPRIFGNLNGVVDG